MKKIMCMIMAFAMVLSMVACQSAPEQPETTPPTTEVQTQPTEVTELLSPAEMLLTSKDTTTTSYEDVMEYENTLRSLGYEEFFIDYWRATEDSGIACHPINLTYNNEAFRFEFGFDYYDGATESVLIDEGWVLYGTKGDSAANIGVCSDNYECTDMLDINEAQPEFATDYRYEIDYFFFNWDENGMHCDEVFNQAVYYPGTNNLYNLVKEYGDGEATREMHIPELLAENGESAASTVSRPDEIYQTFGEVAEFTIQWGDNTETYQYQLDMTLVDWCASEYNTAHWFADGDKVWSPDCCYSVFDGASDIRDIPTINGVIVAVADNLGTFTVGVQEATPEELEEVLRQIEEAEKEKEELEKQGFVFDD